MRNKNNEGKACDAVVKAIEKRTGVMRSQVHRPETDGVGPLVDLRLKLGDQEYAIEHTLIEPFENQIKMEVIVREILDYFKENIHCHSRVRRTISCNTQLTFLCLMVQPSAVAP